MQKSQKRSCTKRGEVGPDERAFAAQERKNRIKIDTKNCKRDCYKEPV